MPWASRAFAWPFCKSWLDGLFMRCPRLCCPPGAARRSAWPSIWPAALLCATCWSRWRSASARWGCAASPASTTLRCSSTRRRGVSTSLTPRSASLMCTFRKCSPNLPSSLYLCSAFGQGFAVAPLLLANCRVQRPADGPLLHYCHVLTLWALLQVLESEPTTPLPRAALAQLRRLQGTEALTEFVHTFLLERVRPSPAYLQFLRDADQAALPLNTLTRPAVPQRRATAQTEKCPHCPFASPQPQKLAEHTAKHSGEGFACPHW